LWIINDATHHIKELPAYVKTLPIPTIQSGVIHRDDIDGRRATIVEIICILESLALFWLAALLHTYSGQKRSIRCIILTTAIVLGTLALFSPSMLGVDLYLYVGQAEILPSAYHPGLIRLSGDSAVIHTIWGFPLFPSAYGPLWITLSKLAITLAPTLPAKLFALRLLELSAIALCIGLLAALRKPLDVIALLAVNPAVYDIFVNEGHNDITAVAFLLAAMLAREKSSIAAILLTAAAGAIKLTFIPIGMLVFIAEPTIRRRIGLWLTSAIAAVGVSLMSAGPWYGWSLHRAYAIYTTVSPQPPDEALLHAILAVIALCALFLALTGKRFFNGAAWSMLALGPYIPPQYLAWSFAYAWAPEESNIPFFASLPIAVYLLNTDYAITPFFIGLRIVLIIVPMTVLICVLLGNGKQRKAQGKPSLTEQNTDLRP
jgi:hypothetical protein